jgi:hypothetical protein
VAAPMELHAFTTIHAIWHNPSCWEPEHTKQLTWRKKISIATIANPVPPEILLPSPELVRNFFF